MFAEVTTLEFHEKLQKLRKQRNLTQEQLAKELFVSRTAISKWESGRGYPGIDSLKVIANFFGVTLDQMLSGEEILTIAREDQAKKQSLFTDFVFGLLDISVILLLILPLFGQVTDTGISAVSLAELVSVTIYTKVFYFAAVIVSVIFGIMTILLQKFRSPFWLRGKRVASVFLSIMTVLLFILSQQPYCAVFCFALLVIKTMISRKS